MEVLKLDIIGSYSYKPDIEIVSYDQKNNNLTECIICKRFLLEPSYETISNNKNILNENNIYIGKCGHIFHGDCICEWIKQNECCPIDKVKWHLHKIADTTTKLVILDKNPIKRKYLNNQINNKNFKK